MKEEREERSARSGSSGPLGGSEADTWLLQLFSSTACRAALSSPEDAFSEDLSERYRRCFTETVLRVMMQQEENNYILQNHKKDESKHLFNEGNYP